MNTKSQEMLSVLVIGAAGRMGRMVREVTETAHHARVGGLLEHAQHPGIGEVLQPENLLLEGHFSRAVQGCHVGISFALPEGLMGHLDAAMQHNLPLVIGSTGLDGAHQEALRQAGQKIPLCWAPNMSMGVALLRKLVRETAQNLPSASEGAGFDIEVVESHHRFKVDSPSGTAIALGQAAAEGRRIDHDTHAVFSRPRLGDARPADSIGYASLRGGGIIGDHQVQFTSANEQICLSHRALSRELFASSALRLAQWLVQQSVGLYGIDDLFSSD